MSLASRCALGLVVALACLAPGVAQAQTFLNYPTFHGESQQNFELEFRFAPYNSFVDSEFSNPNTHPYCDIFGGFVTANGSCPQNPQLMGGFEFDWQAVRLGPVGQLGFGLSAMYSQVTGAAPFTEHMDGPNSLMGNGTPNWQHSTEQTALNVVDMALLAVVRFDGIMRRWRYIPLVPYAKLGFGYGLWFATKGGNLETVAVSGGTAQTMGGSPGWYVGAGVSVLLDFFDSRMARELDAAQGVNHTYLFVEVYRMDLSGFGTRPQLNVGDQNIVGGMSFEF